MTRVLQNPNAVVETEAQLLKDWMVNVKDLLTKDNKSSRYDLWNQYIPDSMVLVGLQILSEKNESRTDTGLGFSLK